MAKTLPHAVQATGAQIVSDGELPDASQADDKFAPLGAWVKERVDTWCQWRDSNYAAKWDTYERLWRGIFDASERVRSSERSTIVNPALSEAVENAAAELEEAVFGRGADYFDLASPEDDGL